MTELFIEIKVLNRLGNKLLHDENMELHILKEYKLVRDDINLYDVAGKSLSKYYFGNDDKYDFSKIDAFFNENTFLTIVTMFIETIDIILLNRIDDVDVKDIVFDRLMDDGCYFRIIPRVKETI